MSLVTKIIDHWDDGKRLHVVATLTAAGNYPAGGDPLILTDPLIKSNSAPTYAVAQGLGGNNYVVVPGAYLSNPPTAKLRVFIDSTGAELGAGAYPAAITGNPIQLYAVFPKFI